MHTCVACAWAGSLSFVLYPYFRPEKVLHLDYHDSLPAAVATNLSPIVFSRSGSFLLSLNALVAYSPNSTHALWISTRATTYHISPHAACLFCPCKKAEQPAGPLESQRAPSVTAQITRRPGLRLLPPSLPLSLSALRLTLSQTPATPYESRTALPSCHRLDSEGVQFWLPADCVSACG